MYSIFAFLYVLEVLAGTRPFSQLLVYQVLAKFSSSPDFDASGTQK